MKKLIAISAILLLSFTQIAQAKIGWRNLEEDVKLQRVCITVLLPTIGTDVTVGIGGVIGTKTASGAASIDMDSGGTELSSLPYPAKLKLIMHDASANGTVVCTSVVVTGTDQFGLPVKETSSANEAGVTTTTVWGTVTDVAATGCSGGATGDLLQVVLDDEIGLGVKIARATDIESVCMDDADAEIQCIAQDDGTAYDIASLVDLTDYSFDLLSATAVFGTGSKEDIDDGDGLCFQIRSSRRGTF